MVDEGNISPFSSTGKCSLYECVSKREINTAPPAPASDFNRPKLHSTALPFKSAKEVPAPIHCSSPPTHMSTVAAVPGDPSTSRKFLKVRRLTTLNLLYYLEESFIKADVHLLQQLDRICEELRSRKDLFEHSLQFIKSRRVRGELYYWIPGCKVDNVFSLIKQLIPNFTKQYKKYFIESVVLNHEYIDAQEFIKERFVGDWEQFSLMRRDMELFPSLITLPFWMDADSTVDMYMSDKHTQRPEDAYFAEKVCQTPSTASNLYDEASIQQITETRNRLILFTDDVSGIMVPEVSFIDFNIGNRNFVCSLSAYLGLVNRDKPFEQFWIDRNVIDAEWNIL